jgi:hypothetical protein
MTRYIYTYLLLRNTGEIYHDRQSDTEGPVYDEISEHKTLDEAKAAVPGADWTTPIALPIPGWVTTEMEFIQEFKYYTWDKAYMIHQHSILTDEAMRELGVFFPGDAQWTSS